MRRIVIIAPDLPDATGEHSIIRSEMPVLAQFREHSVLSKVQNTAKGGSIEAEYLGLGGEAVSMQQGPLTIAALGFDPPDRSTQFHLSLLSTENGIAKVPSTQLDRDTQYLVLNEARKLNTRRITICEGDGVDHGLVVESGSPEVVDVEPKLAEGKVLRECLPQGEDELDLRRFIDDSVNLLSEQDFNQRRMDENLPPINLLWPWGGGWRHHVPNLGIRFGEIGYIASNSLRMQGLTRLAGWKHCSRQDIRSGTRINFEYLLNWVREHELSLCVISEFRELRAGEKFEELSWLASEMNRRLLAPLYDDLLESEVQITVLSPSSQADTSGIAMKARHRKLAEGHLPFDERLIDEKGVPSFSIAETVRRGIVESE